jgi:hypothetical protein
VYGEGFTCYRDIYSTVGKGVSRVKVERVEELLCRESNKISRNKRPLSRIGKPHVGGFGNDQHSLNRQ